VPCRRASALKIWNVGQSPVSWFEGRKKIMIWKTPTIVEICIGFEINGYLPAEF
jgi:coenzyme PQQ precursor peptide PqqA